MVGRLVIGLTALCLLWPAIAQEGAVGDSSQILKKLDEINQRLSGIEQQINQIRFTLRRLEGEKKGPQEKPPQGFGTDPRELWQAMGNPTELAKRLDMLVGVVTPTLPEEGRREEFKKDVQALKEKIGTKLSEEELYNLVRQRLSERLEKSPNEREKAWLQGQLDALKRADGEERKEMLDGFVRIQNIRALHELARKYSIRREQMVKCGLAFVGYRRRPPGEAHRPEGGRRPEGPRRNGPSPPRKGARR